MYLTLEEIVDTFINTKLEEDYNFLRNDLVTLAEAFCSAAAPKIQLQEREACVDIARSVNTLVADKILQVRNSTR